MELHKIAVIGTINRDVIITQGGGCIESLGGILYNVLSLAEVGSRHLTVSPVTYIGADTKPKLFEMLDRRTGISLGEITETPGETNENRLVYLNENERRETAAFHTPAIPYEKIAPVLSSDILLFNFIAGYDVSLDTLRAVKSRTKAKIFIDVHSMVLEQTTHGERAFIPVKNWKMWVAQTDMMQMNTLELLYLTGNATAATKAAPATIAARMKDILHLGPRLVIVTAGHHGIFLGMKRSIYFFPQKYGGPVNDTTGCGDIFTAAFLAKLLISEDPFISCDYANTLAGLATRETGIKKCFTLKHSSPLSYYSTLTCTTSLPRADHSRSGNCGSP